MNTSLLTLRLCNLSINLIFGYFLLNRPEISVKSSFSSNFELKGIFFWKEETSFGLFWICFRIICHSLQKLFDFITLTFAFIIIEALYGNTVVSGVKKMIDLIFLFLVIRLLREVRMRKNISAFIVIQRFIEILEYYIYRRADLLVTIDEIKEKVYIF